MQKLLKQIKRRYRTLHAWVKALSPFIWRTLTLKRSLTNRRLKRASQPEGEIDEYFSMSINGHRQWLRIRGDAASNPVILYLHGGPGSSQIPSYRSYQLSWETDYTVVHWEQRGAGKSYSSSLDPSTLTVPQLVDDALAVVDYLRNRFERNDIILLGHSWGTMLAIHLLRRRSDSIAAYVGVGQVAHLVKSERRMYQFALDKAISTGNEQAQIQLCALKNYPEFNSAPHQIARVRYWARNFGFLSSRPEDYGRNHKRLMTTPEYGLFDVYRFLKGSLVCAAHVGKALFTDSSIQPMALEKSFSVPMFLISGRRDHFTPTDMADEYLNSISAPAKKHIVFEDSGHYPNEDDPQRFVEVLSDLVKPHLKSHQHAERTL